MCPYVHTHASLCLCVYVLTLYECFLTLIRICPHSYMHASLCLYSWLLMLPIMCPYVYMHTSLCWYACLLMLPIICPYVHTHASLCWYACLLTLPIICPYVYTHTSLCWYTCVLMLIHECVLHSCCSKCRRRKGRSAFRKGSRQSARRINSLYDIYTLNEGIPKKLAAQKIRRWGFHPDRRCELPVVCKQLLIRCPGHKDDLFPGLDFRDRVHGLFTFLFRTLMTSFTRMGLTGKTKQMLDQRLTTLGLERMMRDPKTCRSFRVQKSLFTDEGMTGEDRVQWIFQIPHILGHEALCLPDNLRYPVLEAFSRAQLMIIASRSFRAYNVAELDFIFDQGFKRFFTCMETIFEVNHNRIHAERLRRHRKNPRKYRAPVQFKRQKR